MYEQLYVPCIEQTFWTLIDALMIDWSANGKLQRNKIEIGYKYKYNKMLLTQHLVEA